MIPLLEAWRHMIMEREQETHRHRSHSSHHRQHHHRKRSRSSSRSRSRSRSKRHHPRSCKSRSRSRSRSTSREQKHDHHNRHSDQRHRTHSSHSHRRSRDESHPRRSRDSKEEPEEMIKNNSHGPWTYHPPPAAGIPIPSHPLPIHSYKEELRQMLAANQICIITGDTGSGKSTQLCQFMYEFGASQHGLIGVTQPRRIGAVSLAKRVSSELKPYTPPHLQPLGKLVGYSVRFDEVSSTDTQIKFLTDGCLLREVLSSPNLDAYSTIILDEAHERSLHTDVLFGIVKRIVIENKRKYPLKVIVTSATLDTSKFCAFFNNAPLVQIPGRCFPVKEVFLESSSETKESSDVDERYFVERSVEKCLDIHLNTPANSGHILCFLTGQEEIERAVKRLEKKLDDMYADGMDVSDVVVLSLYATLPAADQQKVFQPTGPDTRKVVFSTNISETSLTVDGVAYVVDCGLSKQKEWDAQTGIHTLAIAPISQTSAKQRMGRAGRTREGVCYRLYSKAAYDAFPVDILPEIQRTNLSSTILLLKNLHIKDLLAFEFIDRPQEKHLLKSLLELAAIEAIDERGELTSLGQHLIHFPLEPTQAKMIMTGAVLGCVDEMLTIVSMMSTMNETLWVGRRGSEQDENKRMFESAFGDYITQLFLYDSWAAEKFSMDWLKRYGINQRAMKQVKDVREQLTKIMDKHKNMIQEVVKEEKIRLKARGEESEPMDVITAVRKTIAITLFHQLARLNTTPASISSSSRSSSTDISYRPYPDDAPTLQATDNSSKSTGALDLGLFTTSSSSRGGIRFYIHPSSSIASVQPPPKWIVYSEIVETGKSWMRNCCAIEYSWIQTLVGRMKNMNVQALAGSSTRSSTSKVATSTSTAAVESEAEIQAREALELRQQLLSASKLTVDAASVSDAKARYLERKKAQEARHK